MPARQFFSMLENGRRLDNERRWQTMVDLCDVQAISICSGEYHEQVRSSFIAKITGGQWRRGSAIVMDATDPRAAKILEDVFAQKSKLEGLC